MTFTYRLRRATLLSFLLCGVICPATAFAVRTRTRQVSSPVAAAGANSTSRENRLHLIIRGSADLFTNHSNKSRSQTALSVASGGADGPSNLERFLAFTSKNFFLLGMVAAVSLARAFPHVSTCMLKKRSVISMSTYQHHCILIRSLITLLFGHINVPS